MSPAIELARHYPGVMVWYGIYTKSWWAYVPHDRGFLIEANDPRHLARKLATMTAMGPDRPPCLRSPWQR
jgi:hypothetical protein